MRNSKLIFYLLGLVGFVLICAFMDLGAARGAMRYKILADAAAFPAVLLLSFGAVVGISRDFFDIFSYVLSRILVIFNRAHTDISYYDFKIARGQRKRSSPRHAYFAGLTLLLLSAGFTVMFYLA